MDPQACWDRLLTAIEENDHAEATAAAGDLLSWVLAGGHLPASIPGQREAVSLWFAHMADAQETA